MHGCLCLLLFGKGDGGSGALCCVHACGDWEYEWIDLEWFGLGGFCMSGGWVSGVYAFL